MTGAGTDKTKTGFDLAGPVVVLVEPQLGENIGMAARAMGNFALSRLRIVNPRDGWPNVSAQRAAAGADLILERAELFDSVEAAVADLTLLFATTARAHDQAKPVVAPERAAAEIVAHTAGGGKAGILFGRERYGLQNEEVALANRIITFPVNPGFASLNLAQAVLLIGYEWFKLSTEGALPFAMPERSERASQHQMQAFFENLVRELDRVEFLRPAEKRATMLVNLRNIFTRMEPTKQDMHTLHGVVMAIAEGRKGPAKGGVLDGAQATRLRALLAEHEQASSTSETSSSVRGLARLLRRDPTDAERLLWQALTREKVARVSTPSPAIHATDANIDSLRSANPPHDLRYTSTSCAAAPLAPFGFFACEGPNSEQAASPAISATPGLRDTIAATIAPSINNAS